jgi:hypothetical protein
MKPWIIYTLRDPRTNAIRYVGATTQTLRKRLSGHVRKLSRDTPKCAWIRELLACGLEPSIEAVETGFGNWDEAERLWIQRCKDEGCLLTNTTIGGNGTVGYQITPEVRAKIGAALKGKKHSPEWSANFAAAHRALGRKVSEERKTALSLAHKGKSFMSPEGRQRVAEYARNRTNGPAMRAKVSLAHTGKTVSPQTRSKLANANLGKKHTPEACAKMRKPADQLKCVCGACHLCRNRDRRRLKTLGLPLPPKLTLKGKPWSQKRREAQERRKANGSL